MPDLVKRTVRLASVAYTDASGRTRRASQGSEVVVHPDDIERFDRLNGTPIQQELTVEEPKRRTRRTKTED